MSEAEKFRKSTEEFWSKMDRKSKLVAARRERTPAHSGTAMSDKPRTPRSTAVALKSAACADRVSRAVLFTRGLARATPPMPVVFSK